VTKYLHTVDQSEHAVQRNQQRDRDEVEDAQILEWGDEHVQETDNLKHGISNLISGRD
jgi:hypothetical protein